MLPVNCAEAEVERNNARKQDRMLPSRKDFSCTPHPLKRTRAPSNRLLEKTLTLHFPVNLNAAVTVVKGFYGCLANSGVIASQPTRARGGLFPPAAIRYLPYALAQRHQLVCFRSLKCVAPPAGPKDLDIRRVGTAQAKMQPRIIAGVEARLTKRRLSLYRGAVANQHASADCAPVGLDSLQL